MAQDKSTISLPIKILNDIPFDKYLKDFTFIVDRKQYKTPRIVADILSPIIRKLNFTDESINVFEINTKNNKNEELKNVNNGSQPDYFADFLKLCTLEQQEISISAKAEYLKYLYYLGNIEEYFRYNSEILDTIDIKEAINTLEEIEYFTINKSEEIDRQYYQKVIDVIASHFDDVDKDRLENLTIGTLSEIFGSPHLRLCD